MSSSFVSLYPTELEPSNTDDGPFATLLNRDAIFKKLGARTSLDVLVIGGGGVGALVARDAALRGLRVLVVERGFFGDRAERWRGRFSLAVRSEVARMLGSALRIRSLSRRILGDLTEITPTDPGLKLGRYSSMAVGIVRSLWRSSPPGRGALGVPDLDERILTRELILAARQEGAFVLSNAEAAFVERVADIGSFRIGVRDLLSDELQEVTVKAVVVTPAQGSPVVTRLGTPLLPNQNQETPVVISVCAVNPRNIRSGEPLLSLELSDGSLAVIEKIAEGLVEVSLHFAGVVPEEGDLSVLIEEACREAGWNVQQEVSRTKTGRRRASRTSVTEKKGLVIIQEKYPWDMESISLAAQKHITTHLGEASAGTSARVSRDLPGSERACEISAFRALARTNGVREGTIELVVKRWRGRVRYLDSFEDGFKEVCPGVLKGEIALALASDQVASLEDLLFGSLQLHYLPNWRGSIPAIVQAASVVRSIPASTEDVKRAISRVAPPTA
jgi:hypothetical protein